MSYRKNKSEKTKKVVVKDYKLRTRRFFLTYPQLPSSISHEDLKKTALSSFESIFKMNRKDFKYVISVESHEDGKPHLHAYLEFGLSQSIYSASKLDLEFDGELRHGDYVSVKSPHVTLRYIIKSVENYDLLTKNMGLPSYNRKKVVVKDYRLKTRRFFLTYPRLPSSISHEDLKETALSSFELIFKMNREDFKYVISVESHEDGRPYLHAYLEFGLSQSIYSASKLDLEFGGEFRHGNYVSVKSPYDTLGYIIKSAENYDLLTKNMRLPWFPSYNRKKVVVKDYKLRTRRFFLTYPQLPSSISHEDLKETALSSFELIFKMNRKDFKHVISVKLHEDGRPDLHAYLEFGLLQSIYSASKLDLEFDGESRHGDYVSVKSLRDTLRYIIQSAENHDSLTKNMRLPLYNRKKVKVKDYQLKTRRFFLTYPQLPSGISYEDLKETALSSFELIFKMNRKDFKYVISVELHEDGRPDLHAYLEFGLSQSIYSASKLDLEFDGESRHGDYVSVKSPHDTLRYIIKSAENYDLLTKNMRLPSYNRKKVVVKDYKLRTRRFFLTYPELPSGISHEDLKETALSNFESIFKMNRKDFKFVISVESHEDGKHHLHAYLEFGLLQSIYSASKLDLEFNGEFRHGDYVSVKSPHDTLRYIIKSVENYNLLTKNMRLPLYNRKKVVVKDYKLRTRRFFLTYPELPSGISHEDLKETALSSFELIFKMNRKDFKYVISVELQEDGKPHLHAYLEFGLSQSIYSASKLDLEFDGELRHGDYVSVKSPHDTLWYIIKSVENYDLLTKNMRLPSYNRKKVVVKDYKLRTRRFFLTYPELPSLISHEDLKETALSSFELIFKMNRKNFKYVISVELQEDGKLHLHAYLEFGLSQSIYSASKLDLEFDGELCHGYYVPVKSPHDTLRYIIKSVENCDLLTKNMGLSLYNGRYYSNIEEYAHEIRVNEGPRGVFDALHALIYPKESS